MTQLHVYLPWVNACLAKCLNSVLNVKVLVGTFNQEKTLVILCDYEIFVNLCLTLEATPPAAPSTAASAVTSPSQCPVLYPQCTEENNGEVTCRGFEYIKYVLFLIDSK